MWKQKPSKAWTGLLYEDSANENWLQLLEETKLKIFISPWHERDLKEDGTYKKKHRHVVAIWEEEIEYEQAKSILEKSGVVLHYYGVYTLTGVVRYLTHKDNPDKEQYKDEEVICLNGANYKETIKGTIE